MFIQTRQQQPAFLPLFSDTFYNFDFQPPCLPNAAVKETTICLLIARETFKGLFEQDALHTFRSVIHV